MSKHIFLEPARLQDSNFCHKDAIFICFDKDN